MSVTAERGMAGKHTGLKILVAVLGVLLVFGFLGLIVMMVYQAGGSKSQAADPAAAISEGLPSFGNITVPIRQGERIARIQPSGDRLFVELATVEGSSRLVVIDQATGRVLGSIDFAPQP